MKESFFQKYFITDRCNSNSQPQLQNHKLENMLFELYHLVLEAQSTTLMLS